MTYDPNYRPAPFGGGPPRKRRTGLLITLAVAAAVCLLCVIGAMANSAHKAAEPIAGRAVDIAEGATSAPDAKAPAKPKAATVGSGTWEVGTEIKPGTYTTTAQDHCYWARLKTFDGGFDAIIANGNLDPGGHGRLTVKKTDKGLELFGDCTWKLAG